MTYVRKAATPDGVCKNCGRVLSFICTRQVTMGQRGCPHHPGHEPSLPLADSIALLLRDDGHQSARAVFANALVTDPRELAHLAAAWSLAKAHEMSTVSNATPSQRAMAIKDASTAATKLWQLDVVDRHAKALQATAPDAMTVDVASLSDDELKVITGVLDRGQGAIDATADVISQTKGQVVDTEDPAPSSEPGPGSHDPEDA